MVETRGDRTDRPAARQPTSRAEPRSRDARAAVCALTAAALAIGVFNLGRKSFWLDEAYTWSTVDRPFPDLVRLLARNEGLQILHSLALWPIRRLSDTEWALRLPSTLAFAATVPTIWLVGRRLLDARAALIAAALLALNGWALQYAQEARSYSLAMLTVTAAAVALARDVQAPSRVSRAVWVISAAAAVYAHGIMVLFVFAQWIALFALPRERWRIRRWITNAGVFVLVASPAIVAPVLQVNTTRDYDWIGRPGLHSFAGLAWLVSGRTVTGLPILLAAAATVAVLGRRFRQPDRWPLVMLTSWAVIPPAVLMLVSEVKPLYLDRYVLPMLPAVLLLAAALLSRIRSARILAVVLVTVLAMEARGVIRWYDWPPNEEWRQLSAQLLARARKGDAIAFAIDDVRLTFEYYARDDVRLERLDPLVPFQPWGAYKTGEQQGHDFQAADIDRIVRARPARLWVVMGHTGDETMQPLLDQIRTRAHYSNALHQEYQGRLEVVLLVRGSDTRELSTRAEQPHTG